MYVGNTTDWKIWGGATYLEIFLSWWFSRLHIMWIYYCNVGKTKRLKKNVKENIWYHQKMNSKKYVYFDNDPYTWHTTEVNLDILIAFPCLYRSVLLLWICNIKNCSLTCTSLNFRELYVHQILKILQNLIKSLIKYRITNKSMQSIVLSHTRGRRGRDRMVVGNYGS